MAGNPIRIGLIGCGRVAHNHAMSISRCPNAVLAAAAGGRKAETFGQEYNIPIMSTDEIIERADIDALLILTPPESHCGYVMAALNSGKHVLVEKPVSFEPDEIVSMYRAAEKSGLVCMPGHSYLYIPELVRMAREIPAGGIGLPTYLYLSETYYMPPELFALYKGPDYDVLCHELYMSLAFLGTPCLISALRTEFSKKRIPTGGTQAAVMMQYSSGTIAHILVSWAADDHANDPFGFKVKAVGSEGGMHFSRMDYVRWSDDGLVQMGYQEMFDRQMEWFVNRCIINGEPPISTMRDAETVCRLHNCVLESIRTKSTLPFDAQKETEL